MVERRREECGRSALQGRQGQNRYQNISSVKKIIFGFGFTVIKKYYFFLEKSSVVDSDFLVISYPGFDDKTLNICC
jgi:hypothetical protein